MADCEHFWLPIYGTVDPYAQPTTEFIPARKRCGKCGRVEPRADTMIDHATDALMAAEGWSTPRGREDARKLVRAVVGALREPTPAHVSKVNDAACERYGVESSLYAYGPVEWCWQAMIDCVLDEDKEGGE